MPNTVLEVQDLHTHFNTREGVVKAVNGVSLTLKEDSILALVGESGSGKSVTALSILGLLPFPGKVVQGKVIFNGKDLVSMDPEELRGIRGRDISMVFQDPRASLNPILPIGTQVQEILLAHQNISKKAARQIAEDVLREVGLPDPKRVLDQYPFHLSGGMCQRVMISIALALRPKVLIADEPTTNLDMTLQAEILDRLRKLARNNHASILLITHDMGVVAGMADDVVVMYAGTVMEQAQVRTLYKHPAHPYTFSLFQAIPRLDDVSRRLQTIRGAPPDMINLPEECPFLPRCSKANNTCRLNPKPPLSEVEPGHSAACYNRVMFEYFEKE